MKNIWKGTLIIAFTLLLDQLSKGVVQKMLLPGEEQVFIPKFMSIIYIQDSATTLGFLSHWDMKLRNMFLILFSLLIVMWAIRRLIMLRGDFFRVLPYILVVAGLFGNLMDRLLYGYVVSFIKVSGWVFNFSDISIMLAILLSIFNMYYLFREKNVSPAL